MKINILLEGGVGDLILATRFVAAVREQYPESHITVFVNNDKNDKYNSFLDKHWGHLWNSFEPNVERISDKHQIVSQFGPENYNAAINNIKPEWRTKLNDCDKFYNFHLDALKFLEYQDIPWLKYMKCVPRPRNLEPALYADVVVNLYARPDHFSAITKQQSDSIIDNIKGSHKTLIIAPNEEVKNTFYEKHKEITVCADLTESLSIISKSKIGVSIDSGLRCMFYPFGLGCYTLCALAQKPFEIVQSHVVRWYMWPEHILPIDVKPAYLSTLVDNALENRACLIYPQYPAARINDVLVKRNYD